MVGETSEALNFSLFLFLVHHFGVVRQKYFAGFSSILTQLLQSIWNGGS